MINLGQVAERGAPGLGGVRGAALWYERAGKKGEGMGWFKLYQFLSVGREELTRDVGAALTYLRQAAELGHPEAQWTLGHLLLKGQGMAADGQAAVNWFHRLTQQRTDPRYADLGRIELAKMYRDGQLKKSETEGGDRAMSDPHLHATGGARQRQRRLPTGRDLRRPALPGGGRGHGGVAGTASRPSWAPTKASCTCRGG